MHASSVNPYLEGLDATDEKLIADVRNPSPHRSRSVDTEISASKQAAAILSTRFDLEGSASVCTPEAKAAASDFIRTARSNGLAEQAFRVSILLFKNGCFILGVCR